jgi:hypothetical protein
VLIKQTPAFETPNNVLRDQVDETLRSANGGSIVEVRGVLDIEVALETAAAGLIVLRLFQLARRQWTETTFGLPGELYSASINYVAAWRNAAHGWTHRGHFTGYSFSDESYADWSSSPAFQFLSDALADPDRSESSRRAVTGALLLDRAAVGASIRSQDDWIG